MKRSQLAVALVAILAVAAVAYFGREGAELPSLGGSGPATDAVRVPFVLSPEKEALLRPLIERFNGEGVEVGGKPVFVEAEVLASGEAQTRIAEGRLRPVAWSPASSLWGRLLNFEADRPLAPEESPSIVRTPLVIAMWKPLADALGYPRRPVGFDDILRLARSDRGWAAYGRPQFGDFKLVHTNPDYSTSGLSAVVAEYYAATGKKEGLTEAEVTASAARRTVRDIERSIVHYGDTTLFIADQMRREGPGYASAVAMEEATLLELNRNRGSQPPLVAVYPEEGTFYSDNPLITLDAPWVRPEQRQGTAALGRFLTEELTPEMAAQAGFRPADPDVEPPPPITREAGADPSQPERVLGLPEARVLAAIRESWREDRKPANVMLVVDTSGSMNDENRLERAKQGLEVFFREVGPNDRVGLTTFSDRVLPLLPLRPFRGARRELESTARDLIADGGTAIYDATAEGVRQVEREASRDSINAVVLLTDGEDTDSALPPEELIASLRQRAGSEGERVRVFTIAYSAGAEGAQQRLTEIAEASGGNDYVGSLEDIESVYRSISSFF